MAYAEVITSTINTNIVNKSALELKSNLGLMYYQNQPFNGTSVTHYNGIVKAESIQYSHGKRHGLYQKWFPNGALSFEAHYVNGLQEGKAKSWWKNGNLRSEANYKGGIVNGIQKQWYKSGAKFKEMSIVNGQEEGLQKAWRENGKIYNNYEAKNGRIFGLKRASLCYELEDEKVKY
ncbi:toxin-antitoxin system YwqK family antitoxin [Psychroserpens sp.]|uniref:toxin-antitoxin system YwqK family antitoxin n=1 Tax=Psychroserpens sp. TaxID=2020870 RepID=UPI002B274094|nr:toxin-antitoxin system YwqK family antitoxin [Psychroserpens sp.]